MKSIKTFVIGAFALASFSSLALAEAELSGYCPVCYVAAGKAVEGTKEFESEYKGKTYLFVNQKAKDAFDTSPDKFLPAYDGLCAYGMSLGKEFAGDPTQFTVFDNVIYLNSSADTKRQFDAEPANFIKAANENFAMLKEKALKEAVK